MIINKKDKAMTRKDLVETARLMVREKGFMPATQLTVELTVLAITNGLQVSEVMIALSELECHDIKAVEYANLSTHEFRRKDLYYYSPEG